MAMEFGEIMKIQHKFTKGITAWIKNQVMEFMSGKMHGFIKEISKMIYAMDLDNYMREVNVHIVDTGKMVNKQIKRSPNLVKMSYSTRLCRKLSESLHHSFITERWEMLKN